MSTQFLAKMFSAYIGIDLGTANCLVYVRDRGIVLNEPSVVAIKVNTNEVLKVGAPAKDMLCKTPKNIKAVRPMKDGVIADYEVTEDMLRYFIRRAIETVPWFKRLLRPHVLIAVPSGITEVEKRAVIDSAKHAGAGEVNLVEEPMAAAIGVGLPVAESYGSMIVDIGGGTTEVAIISLSGIVSSKSAKVGGDTLDKTIINHLKKEYNMQIGEQAAERIKIELGSAYPIQDDLTMVVQGFDLISRHPKAIEIGAGEIRRALQGPITSILEAVHATLDTCDKPDLAADLLDSGIMLAGGGAKLAGLDKFLSEETGMPVFVAEEPLNAVVNGTGVMLQENSIWSA